MSDLVNTHNYSRTYAEAAADALNAGCDQEGARPIPLSVFFF
jgi:hypothetical protein